MSKRYPAMTQAQKRDITIRAERIEREVQEIFQHLYQRSDLIALLRRVENASLSARPSRLQTLVELLRSLGADCEGGRELGYYRTVIESLDLPEDDEALNVKVLRTLHEIYRSYPTPEQFMERIVRSLAPDAFPADSVRLIVLRRFVETVNVKENTHYYCKALGNDPSKLDESVFDALNSNDAPRLIVAANDLAKGVYAETASSKEQLFLLAFAFGMRFYPDTAAPEYDVARDVEKNIYEDYYCDNLTRYISSEPRFAASLLDNEPRGTGLNFKNFVDVSFVYYLDRVDLTPRERVEGFYRTIERVKKTWLKDHTAFSPQLKERYLADVDDKETGRTVMNRELVIDEMLSLTEEAFEQALLENFFCDLRYIYTSRTTGATGIGTRGLFEEEFATDSPYRMYCENRDIIRDTIQLPHDVSLEDIDRRRMNGNEESMRAMSRTSLGQAYERMLELEGNMPTLDRFRTVFAEDDPFWAVLNSVADRLEPYAAMSVPSGALMTRTKLIAVYYHRYCLECMQDDYTRKGDDWLNFSEFFSDFTTCINTYLELAGYALFSPKSIYDMLVVLFTYCTINGMLIKEKDE